MNKGRRWVFTAGITQMHHLASLAGLLVDIRSDFGMVRQLGQFSLVAWECISAVISSLCALTRLWYGWSPPYSPH